MRTFLMYSHATTSPNFDSSNTYEAGRLDVVIRCCLNVLWISERIRDNAQFIVSLNGGPAPPVAIKFDGSKLGNIIPSEQGIAHVIKKAMRAARDENWVACHQGVSVSRKSLQGLIKEVDTLYVLDARGTNIYKAAPREGTYLFGDNAGIPSKELAFALRKGERISLGRHTYLASFAVAVVNWVLDQK